MSETVRITAHWALWSKRQGTREDYGVINASEGRYTPGQYAQMLQYFASGNPGSGRSLPRVVLSWVGGRNPAVGFAIQRGSRIRDGAGRPVAPTYHFCLPWEQLAEHPVSYTDVFSALMREHEKITEQSPRTPVELALPPLDPVRAAQAVEELGRAYVETAAALLLGTDQVCVVQDDLALPDRLRLLDAALCLLPYGYRAQFSGATWASSSAHHPLLLFFADQAAAGGEGRVTLTPATAAEIPLRGHEAEYFRRLERLRHLDLDLADVVGALAADRESRPLSEPGQAVGRLRDLEDDVRGRRHPARTDPEAARSSCAGEDPEIAMMRPEDRRTTLTALIEQGDRTDAPAIRRWWPVVAAETAPPLRQLIGYARRLLSSADGVAWHDLPDLGRDADAFLAEAVRPPEPGQDGAAEFLDRACGVLLDLRDFPAGHPETLEVLTGHPDLACAFLARSALRDRHTDTARRLLAGLRGNRYPAWLAPFEDLLTLGTMLPGWPDVALGGDPARVGRLVTFARALRLVLSPSALAELIEWFVRTRTERRAEPLWPEILHELSSCGLRAEAAARILVIAYRPPDLAEPVRAERFGELLRSAVPGGIAKVRAVLEDLAGELEGEAGGPITDALEYRPGPSAEGARAGGSSPAAVARVHPVPGPRPDDEPDAGGAGPTRVEPLEKDDYIGTLDKDNAAEWAQGDPTRPDDRALPVPGPTGVPVHDRDAATLRTAQAFPYDDRPPPAGLHPPAGTALAEVTYAEGLERMAPHDRAKELDAFVEGWLAGRYKPHRIPDEADLRELTRICRYQVAILSTVRAQGRLPVDCRALYDELARTLRGAAPATVAEYDLPGTGSPADGGGHG